MKHLGEAMRHIEKYFKPATIEEAITLLRQYPNSARCLAGGAYVTQQNDPAVKYLIDITYCGLNYIKEQDGQVCIGACATLEDLSQSNLLNGFASGILCEVAHWTGSWQLRNGATVGGSLVLRQDLALALLALDAQLVLVGDGERIVPLAECYRQNSEFLSKAELIKECRIPTDFRDAIGKAQRMSRTRQDVSLISVAAVVKQKQGVCQTARIAVGPVATGMSRVPAIEALLEGQTVTPDLIARAAERLTQDVQPIEDFRASAEYRRKMIVTHMQRVLFECFAGN
jgi:aerobic carbon-monoxide dehydrogenase medium subunit